MEIPPGPDHRKEPIASRGKAKRPNDLAAPEIAPREATHAEFPAATTRDAYSRKAMESAVIALTPPSSRSPPGARPFRPLSSMGFDLPPNASPGPIAPDPLCEIHPYIGTQPSNPGALLHCQAIAGDLRLGHQLYNWSVFGLAPCSLAPTAPFTGGEGDNSDDHAPSG